MPAPDTWNDPVPYRLGLLRRLQRRSPDRNQERPGRLSADAAQEQKLEELTLKIEDVETLLEDVSDVAYDKAGEVVTDKVREQTQLEDLEVIEKYRKSVVSPNAKNSPEVVKIANTLLGRAREKLQQSAEKILKKVQAVLLKPEVKQAGKEHYFSFTVFPQDLNSAPILNGTNSSPRTAPVPHHQW